MKNTLHIGDLARQAGVTNSLIRYYEEIDLFNWQQAVADMVSVSELEVELSTSQGLIRRAVERGELNADHTIPLGERVYHYFREDRIEGELTDTKQVDVSANKYYYFLSLALLLMLTDVLINIKIIRI